MTKCMNLAWLALALMTAATAAAQTYNATAFTLTPPSGVGPGQFTNGNGDAANFSTVDNEIDSWWGLGIKGLCCSNYSGYGIVFDARSGSIYTQGKVGIGTTSPSSKLHILGSDWNGITLTNSVDANTIGTLKNDALGTYVSGKRFLILSDETPNTDGSNGGIMFRTNNGSNGTDTASAMVIRETGNVGIGTTNPGYKLDVAGQIHTSGVVFPDGNIQTVAYTGTCSGGDYAESVDVTGDRKHYEPGDVLVLDADNPGKMLKSIEAYSTSVSGIYSTKPGTVGRRQTTAKSPDEVPMAVVGIVPAKVSAENGPIKVGDLLVTSSSPGYAMKGTDRSRMLGAVVGKAMAKLDSDTGVIEVLVTLQ